MNENEIGRIAAATNQLRPDWPTASIATLISQRLTDRPRRDVAIALTWIACDSTSKTPARVLENGPWWKAAAIDTPDTTRQPPKKHQECGRHAGEYRTSCRGCAADRQAWDAIADDAQTEHFTPDEALHQMRAAIHAAQLTDQP